MNLKLTLILALVFIAIGSVAMLDSFKWQEDKRAAKERTERIFWLEDARLDWIKIQASKKDLSAYPLEIKCVDEKSAIKVDGCELNTKSNWQLVNPVQTDGDASKINAFLTNLRFLKPVEEVRIAENDKTWRKKYGLVNAEFKISFKLNKNAQVYELELGDSAPIGKSRFVYSNQQKDKVYLLPSHAIRSLEREIDYWRAKSLFPGAKTSNIGQLEWKRPGKGRIAFEHTEDGWQLTYPYSAQADDAAIQGLLTSLLNIQAERVTQEQKRERGKFAWEFVLTDVENKKKISLNLKKIGAIKERLLAFSSERKWSSEISASHLLGFMKEVDLYRERRILLPEENMRIHAMQIRFRDDNYRTNIELEKKAGNWVWANKLAEDKRVVKQESVGKLINALLQSPLQRFSRSKSLLKKWKNKDVLLSFLDKQGNKFKQVQITATKFGPLINGDLSGEVRLLTKSTVRKIPLRVADILIEPKLEKKKAK